MFDLPVDTKLSRKQYSTFRKSLLNDGFNMVQFSIYERHCSSEDNMEVHCRRVEGFLPPGGEVRVLTVTDKQYEKMRIYWGDVKKPTPPPPAQLELF